MKRKRISRILIIAILFSVFNTRVVAKADSISINDTSSSAIEQVSMEETLPEEIPEKIANTVDRPYLGENYMLQNGARTYDRGAVRADNTDPNYAYLVTNDTVTQGVVNTTGEMRWYGVSLNEKSKVTILLQMAEGLDADLYVFLLNQETYELELIGGSATQGVGYYEYFNNVMDKGIYYFAVGGYEGTGAFALAYYQSTADVAYEVNDSLESATAVAFDNNITGVIDNPNDVDYYKITVSSTTLIQYSITSTEEYSLLYGGCSGDNANINNVPGTKNKTYKIKPGTYYFAVVSESDKYSSSKTYTVNFSKIGAMSSDPALTIMGLSEDGGIIYQTNERRTLNYINGKPINYSYSFYDEIINSAGTQFYDIAIDTNAGACVSNSEGFQPEAVHYISSTKPALKVSSRPALLLTYAHPSKKFYRIHCRGTGAYSSNTVWTETNYVSVLIDPESGQLIDIVDPNYYYQLVPVGHNSILYATSYSITYYKIKGGV